MPNGISQSVASPSLQVKTDYLNLARDVQLRDSSQAKLPTSNPRYHWIEKDPEEQWWISINPLRCSFWPNIWIGLTVRHKQLQTRNSIANQLQARPGRPLCPIIWFLSGKEAPYDLITHERQATHTTPHTEEHADWLTFLASDTTKYNKVWPNNFIISYYIAVFQDANTKYMKKICYIDECRASAICTQCSWQLVSAFFECQHQYKKDWIGLLIPM